MYLQLFLSIAFRKSRMIWKLHLDAQPRLILLKDKKPNPTLGEDSAPAAEDVLQHTEYEDSVRIELAREDVTYKPGGIHVCQELRNIALKRGYEVLSILVGGKQQNFWFNRKTDTVRLETPWIGDALVDCVCERVLFVMWPWTLLDLSAL
jgi:hypothetical protein